MPIRRLNSHLALYPASAGAGARGLLALLREDGLLGFAQGAEATPSSEAVSVLQITLSMASLVLIGVLQKPVRSHPEAKTLICDEWPHICAWMEVLCVQCFTRTEAVPLNDTLLQSSFTAFSGVFAFLEEQQDLCNAQVAELILGMWISLPSNPFLQGESSRNTQPSRYFISAVQLVLKIAVDKLRRADDPTLGSRIESLLHASFESFARSAVCHLRLLRGSWQSYEDNGTYPNINYIQHMLVCAVSIENCNYLGNLLKRAERHWPLFATTLPLCMAVFEQGVGPGMTKVPNNFCLIQACMDHVYLSCHSPRAEDYISLSIRNGLLKFLLVGFAPISKGMKEPEQPRIVQKVLDVMMYDVTPHLVYRSVRKAVRKSLAVWQPRESLLAELTEAVLSAWRLFLGTYQSWSLLGREYATSSQCSWSEVGDLLVSCVESMTKSMTLVHNYLGQRKNLHRMSNCMLLLHRMPAP